MVELNHYTQGPPDAPAVFLGGSLGTALAMWDDTADMLSATYHVVRFDTRGHGSSPAPPGPYSMSELAADVVATADTLGIDRFSYVGLSLGGGIGQSLALEHADRLAALVLCCTAAKFGDPSAWRDRAARVTAEGMGFLAETNKDRWFTAGFQAEHPDVVDDVIAMLAATSPVGYAACCDALADFDVTDRLADITTPTRVIAGAQDPVTPPEVCRQLSDGIDGADLVVIEDAGHIANIAQPNQFTAAVKDHLERHP